MESFVDPMWVQRKIEADELRLINLKAGHYYISRNAEIYSMNMAQPRQIAAVPKLSGEQIIVLYTPQLTAYDVSALVLSTFNPIENPCDLFPCYRDCDPTNCAVTNLFWGDKDDVAKWRKVAIMNAANNNRDTSTPSTDEAKEDINIEQIAAMVFCSPKLQAFFEMIVGTAQRLISQNEYDDETLFLLRMIEMRFKHAANMEYVPLENLRSVFDEEPPDPKIAIMIKRFHERFDKVKPTCER